MAQCFFNEFVVLHHNSPWTWTIFPFSYLLCPLFVCTKSFTGRSFLRSDYSWNHKRKTCWKLSWFQGSCTSTGYTRHHPMLMKSFVVLSTTWQQNFQIAATSLWLNLVANFQASPDSAIRVRRSIIMLLYNVDHTSFLCYHSIAQYPYSLL